jgi:bacterioferritin-associated ferredoxin
MLIDRCLCRSITFRELHDQAVCKELRTVEALMGEVDFGSECGLCVPYVREMLRSGQIEYHAIIEEQSG